MPSHVTYLQANNVNDTEVMQLRREGMRAWRQQNEHEASTRRTDRGDTFEEARVRPLVCVHTNYVRDARPTIMQVDEQRTCTLLILATKHETRSTLLHRPETHTNSTLNVKLCIVATHARCQSGVCTCLPHFSCHSIHKRSRNFIATS